MKRATVFGATLVMLQACIGEDIPFSAREDDAGAVGTVEDGGADAPHTSTPGASGEPDAHSTSKLTLSAEPLDVVRGAPATTLRVSMQWEGSPRTLRVGLEGQPVGYQVGGAVSVTPGTNSVELSIAATEAASYGDGKVTVVATSEDPEVGGTLEVPVFTRGIAGTLDTTFGDGGRLVAPTPDVQVGEKVEAVSIKSLDDGGLLVHGAIDTGHYYKFIIARYDSNGQFATLGAQGYVIWNSPLQFSNNTTRPESTIQEGNAFLVASACSMSSGPRLGYTARISVDGEVELSPQTPPHQLITIDDFAYALPRPTGVLLVGNKTAAMTAVTASGERDPNWPEEITEKPRSSYSSNSASSWISPNHILFHAKLTGNNSSDNWSGYILVNRSNGSVIKRSPYLGDVDDAIFIDESFLVLRQNDGWQRVDAAGTLHQLTSERGTSSGATALASLRDGTVAALTSTWQGQQLSVRMQRFDTNGAAVGPFLTFPAVNIKDPTPLPPFFKPSSPHQAFEDEHHRLVVYYRTMYATTSSSEPVPTWVIRRYWL